MGEDNAPEKSKVRRARYASPDEALAALARNGVPVSQVDKRIVAKGVGIRLLSAVDFLVNYHGYVIVSQI